MRYVTNEQRSRRTLFNPTHRAVASWLMFLSRGRGTHSSRIDLDMLVVTASPARTALKNSQLTCGGVTTICDEPAMEVLKPLEGRCSYL